MQTVTMRYLKTMDFLKKNDNIVEELFKQYIELQPDSEEAYYPDLFIKDIHKEYLTQNKVRLPHPLYATWDIVSKCNLKCVFCSAAAPNTKYEFIENSDSMLIADKIIASKIKYISIRGGEPTLCKNLSAVVAKFVNSGIFVEIVTNGIHIDDNFFETVSLLPSSMYRIKISIDSFNAQTNDSQRGKKSFENATKAMSVCQKWKIPFRTQMVITKLNYNDIWDTYNYCASFDAASFGCMLLLPIGRGRDNKLKISLNKEILLQLIQIIRSPQNTILEKIGLGVDAITYYKPFVSNIDMKYQDAINIGHIKCNGAKTRIYISPSGDVYPCDLLQYREYYLGNIIKNENFWNSDNALHFCEINRSNIPKCKDCKVLGCNMGCLAISIENSKTVDHQIPNCEV